jgi:hypothetical protein
MNTFPNNLDPPCEIVLVESVSPLSTSPPPASPFFLEEPVQKSDVTKKSKHSVYH